MNIFLEQMAAAQPPHWNQTQRGKSGNSSAAAPFESGASHSQFLNLVQGQQTLKRPLALSPKATDPKENARPQTAHLNQSSPARDRSSMAQARNSAQRELTPHESNQAVPNQLRPAPTDPDRKLQAVSPTTAPKSQTVSSSHQGEVPDSPRSGPIDTTAPHQELPATAATWTQSLDSEGENLDHLMLIAGQPTDKDQLDSTLSAYAESGDGDLQAPSEELTEEPIFWFLTGQLQNLNPLSIPPLVLNNQFVQEAMEANSPSEFLNQQQTAGKWLDQLGLSPEKQAQILQYTMLDSEQNISAHQLFKTLGLNPENIGDELSQLQKQLPLEGLTPHMVRAAALQGQNLAQRATNPHPEVAETTMMPAVATTTTESQQGQTGPETMVAAPVAHDPFQMIQRQWNPTDVQRMDFAPSDQSPAWLNQLQDSMLTSESKAIVSDGPGMVFEPVILEQNPIAPIEATALNGQPHLAQVWQASQDINQDEVTLYQLGEDGLMPVDPEKGFSSPQEDHHSHSERKDFSLGNNLGSVATGLAATEQSKTAWDSELQGPQIQRVRQEIINRAEMLIKEGGGSIKIDLNHESLGKVDLAIEIKDQKVEIRMVAGSEKARELLAQELPRLREALQIHDLDLQNIEIGLRQESKWSESNGDGSQREGQSWQEQQDQLDGPWQISRSRRIAQERAWSSPPSTNHHNGQIHVRV